MKTIYIILTILVAFGNSNAQTFNADISESQVKWIGKKAGGQHFGYIQLKNGTFVIENNKFKSGNFTIDMNSISNVDLEDKEYNAKLVNHLKSDDFFGSAEYPESYLKITGGTEFIEESAEIRGELTIKGITHPIIFPVKKAGNIYTSTMTIDRSKYNVKYGSGSFFENLGDNMIDDQFILIIKLVVK